MPNGFSACVARVVRLLNVGRHEWATLQRHGAADALAEIQAREVTRGLGRNALVRRQAQRIAAVVHDVVEVGVDAEMRTDLAEERSAA